MDINEFFNKFVEEIDYLLDEEVLRGKEDKDLLENGTYIYLINVTMYMIAKKNNLEIFPENAIGRGGYTDILFLSKKGDGLFEVEHDNIPLAKRKGITIVSNLNN